LLVEDVFSPPKFPNPLTHTSTSSWKSWLCKVNKELTKKPQLKTLI
jgi:hypothetical protein